MFLFLYSKGSANLWASYIDKNCSLPDNATYVGMGIGFGPRTRHF